MNKELASHISSLMLLGRFGEAYKCIPTLTYDELRSLIYNHPNHKGNVCTYAFLCYFIQKKDAVEYHEITALAIETLFVYLKGAYHMQFYHLNKVIEYSSSEMDVHLNILWFYGLCENVISPYQARIAANKILLIEPDNEEVREVLDSINCDEEVLRDYSGLTPEKAFDFVRSLQRQRFFFPMPMPQDILLADVTVQATSLVIAGRLIEAKKILFNTDIEVFCKTLPGVAQQTRSLCIYAFIWLMMEERETSFLHACAAEIAQIIFQYPNDVRGLHLGSEQIMFFHLHRALELAPRDLNLQKQLLVLYEVTPASFKCGEAEKIAQKVLDHNPENELAKRILVAINSGA